MVIENVEKTLSNGVDDIFELSVFNTCTEGV